MATNIKRRNSRGMMPDGHEQKKDSFFKADHALFASKRYQSLKGLQRGLLHDLCATFNGRNNGDLVLTPTFCDEFNWNYKTVGKNKQALIDSGLVRLVGYKALNNYTMMALYALAWLPLNEDCNKYIEEHAKKKKVLNLKFD
jgi:hypothetical protein